MKILFWCLVLLNLTDFWLTTLIIKKGGVEANPLVLWFIEQFGYIGILYAKIPFLAVMGYVIYFGWNQLSPTFAKFAEYGIWSAVAIYITVNLWSLGIYGTILYK